MKKALAVAQVAVRKHTDQNLQAVSVVFARDDCKEPERKAMDAALQDARGRAERIASLSHAKLGRLVAVSEATSVGSLVTFSNQRCGADVLHAPALFAYQVPSGTADEVTVSITLEVTFALER